MFKSPLLATSLTALAFTCISPQVMAHNISSSKNVTLSNTDTQRFKQITDYAISQKLYQKSMGDVMQAIARQLLNSKYTPGLLDQSHQETLIVSLTQFDCLLFVESVLALARGVVVQDYRYNTLIAHIENQRYRDGKINGYCSRLHYFSEWIEDNQRRGNVKNLTQALGGIDSGIKLNFMSENRAKYPALAKDPFNYECILKVEKDLSRQSIYHIPREKITQLYPRLQAGDIIGVATSTPGLDVTHTGLVYKTPQAVGLIHASPEGKVVIASDLSKYIYNVNNAIGIIVVRPMKSS